MDLGGCVLEWIKPFAEPKVSDTSVVTDLRILDPIHRRVRQQSEVYVLVDRVFELREIRIDPLFLEDGFSSRNEGAPAARIPFR